MKIRDISFTGKLIASAILIHSFTLSVSAQEQEVLKADTVVTNGKIVTMDNTAILDSDPGTIVEAMALRDGRILDLGNNQAMLLRAKPDARILDLRGKTVIPGIIETHVHPESTMSRAVESEERDAYQWAPGLHMAVQVEQQGSATLAKIRQVLRQNPPTRDEWIHISLLPNENTDYPDIGALTNAIYNNYLTMADATRAIPDNPAQLGSGTGQSIVRQEGLVVRVTVAADGKSQSQVLTSPQQGAGNQGTTPAARDLALGDPFDRELFRENMALDQAEADHAHRDCGWATSYRHHGHHCSHRAAVLNERAYEATIDEWPGFVRASNEMMSLTDNSGDRGILAGTFRDAWDLVMFPERTPRELYTDLARRAMEHYATGGVTMIASSIEQGKTLTAFYDLLRQDRRLPVRFGYGYEMFRSPLLYPAGPNIVTLLGSHRSSPHVNPWFWPMGITDGGAGDARRVACFGQDLSGPDMLKDRELCMTGQAYRIDRILKTALKEGWRPFSMHSFGSEAFRNHAQWIEEARQEANMSMQDIRDLRIGFAHGGAIGKIPEVIQIMKDYNFYIPIQPNDVNASLDQVQRYGPEGLEFLAPTKTLLEAGVNVVGETEYSEVHPQIYFNALDTFVNRRIRGADEPVDAARIVMPEEAVSRATALRLYTSRAAEWLFAEDLAGTLEPGKLADFTVLDRDYFSMPREELLDNKVIMTVVGDQVVYQDPDWQPGGTAMVSSN